MVLGADGWTKAAAFHVLKKTSAVTAAATSWVLKNSVRRRSAKTVATAPTATPMHSIIGRRQGQVVAQLQDLELTVWRVHQFSLAAAGAASRKPSSAVMEILHVQASARDQATPTRLRTHSIDKALAPRPNAAISATAQPTVRAILGVGPTTAGSANCTVLSLTQAALTGEVDLGLKT